MDSRIGVNKARNLESGQREITHYLKGKKQLEQQQILKAEDHKDQNEKAQCCSRAEGRDYKPQILHQEKYSSEMKGKSRHIQMKGN